GMGDFLIDLGAWLQIIGNEISDLGTYLLPYSFFAYLPFRLVIYKAQKLIRYNSLVKSLWYLAYGGMLLANDVALDLVVVLITFIEGIDYFFKYLEDRRNTKEAP